MALVASSAGVVYQARDKKSGDIMALKQCLPHHTASDGFPLTTLREITILRELKSTGGERHGIIGLKDVTVSSRYVPLLDSSRGPRISWMAHRDCLANVPSPNIHPPTRKFHIF